MIVVKGTRSRVARVPIGQIVDPSTRRVSVRWLAQYWRDLTARGHEQYDIGVLLLSPRTDGRYTILDGRHRYYASLFAGRSHVLALILVEPGQTGYEQATADDGWMEVA